MRKVIGWLVLCLGILVIMPGGAIASDLGIPAPLSIAIGVGVALILSGWFLSHPKRKEI